MTIFRVLNQFGENVPAEHEHLPGKLTWFERDPAPYESIWSIIAKVVSLNYLSLHELKKLIARKGFSSTDFVSRDFGDTRWIDFAKLAAMLGIDVKRISSEKSTGLLFFIPNDGNYAVRRCELCWARGYHSAIFDLDMVTTCPWHAHPLGRHCPGCASLACFSNRVGRDSLRERRCGKCKTRLPQLPDYFDTKSFSAAELNAIQQHCVDFTDWWNSANVGFSGGEPLLSELLSIGGVSDELRRVQEWQMGRAIDVAGPPPESWGCNIGAKKVKYGSVKGRILSNEQEESSERFIHIRDLTGVQYRSLKRKLYNTYIRPYRKVYLKIKHLTRDESLRINRGDLCLAVLAFAAWRMSVETLCNVEGIDIRRRNNFKILLPEPNQIHLETEGLLSWIFYKFFAIWDHLEQLEKSGVGRIQIRRARNGVDDLFLWRSSQAEGEISRGASQTNLVSVGVLYPSDDRPRSRTSPEATSSTNNEKISDSDDKSLTPTGSISLAGWGTVDCMFQVLFARNGRVPPGMEFVDV